MVQEVEKGRSITSLFLSKTSNAKIHTFALTAVFVGTLIVYLPGVNGPFLFDDLTNILQEPSIAVDSLNAKSLWGIVSDGEQYRTRPLSRITFALNYHFAGQQFRAFDFKLVNLLIHLSNGALIYCLSWMLFTQVRLRVGLGETPARFLPLVAAVLWTLHPIQLTSVLYAVQRMTSLSALFVLMGLVAFTIGRCRLAQHLRFAMPLMFGGLGVGVILGGLSKEPGLLIVLYAGIIELFFFQRATLSVVSRRHLRNFYLGTLAIPVIVGLLILITISESLFSLYDIREFGMFERLLTESRVLFFYLDLLAYPNLRQFGLFHDDIVFSTGLLTPWTTLASVLGWAAIIVVVIRGIRRQALWSFAVSWYLVGHLLESSFLALELVHEHRNYLPSFGLLFGAVFYFNRVFHNTKNLSRMAIPISVCFVLVCGMSTWSRAGIWSDRLTLSESMVRNHPMSYRSQMDYAFALVTLAGNLPQSYERYRTAAALDTRAVLPLIEMAKIVHAYGAIQNSVDVGQVAPNPLDEGFRVQPAWLNAVLPAIIERVDSRLATSVVVPTTTMALLNLGVCARSQSSSCAALAAENLRWHQLAIANPKIRQDDRQRLEYSLQELSVGLGRSTATQ